MNKQEVLRKKRERSLKNEKLKKQFEQVKAKANNKVNTFRAICLFTIPDLIYNSKLNGFTSLM